MNIDNIVLVMTACIAPESDVPVVFLKNSNERLEHYKLALRKYLTLSNFKRIVFCDNSNFEWDTSVFEKLAKDNGKIVEFLRFQGDKEKVVQMGKGYGDAEITSYAVDHSGIIKDDDMIFKVSGRYYLKNINKILSKRINDDYVYAVPVNIRNINAIDGISWLTSQDKYQKFFRNHLENEIDDNNGVYYEHVFYNTIIHNKLAFNAFSPLPIYDVPYAGSSGYKYKYSPIKEFLKNFYVRIFINK